MAKFYLLLGCLCGLHLGWAQTNSVSLPNDPNKSYIYDQRELRAANPHFKRITFYYAEEEKYSDRMIYSIALNKDQIFINVKISIDSDVLFYHNELIELDAQNWLVINYGANGKVVIYRINPVTGTIRHELTGMSPTRPKKLPQSHYYTYAAYPNKDVFFKKMHTLLLVKQLEGQSFGDGVIMSYNYKDQTYTNLAYCQFGIDARMGVYYVPNFVYKKDGSLEVK